MVARQFGTPAVCGAEVLDINVEQRLLTVQTDGRTIEVHEGEWLSIDGGAGGVHPGEPDTLSIF